MNTEEKVAYWLDIAQYDLETAKSMQQSGRYIYVPAGSGKAIKSNIPEEI